jgi:hypothetical protein
MSTEHHVMNRLIVAMVVCAGVAAYCSTVTAVVSAEPTQQDFAVQGFGWVEGFGQQVIETLQLHAVASKG